jgi:hypothetical protein
MGDNTSGATVMLWPIRFPWLGVWMPSGFPDIYIVGNINFYSIPNSNYCWRRGKSVCTTYSTNFQSVYSRKTKRVSLTEIRKITAYGVDDRGSIRNWDTHGNAVSWTHSTNLKLGLCPKGKAARASERSSLMSKFECMVWVLRLRSMALKYGYFQ